MKDAEAPSFFFRRSLGPLPPRALLLVFALLLVSPTESGPATATTTTTTTPPRGPMWPDIAPVHDGHAATEPAQHIDVVTCDVRACNHMCVCQKLVWFLDFNHPKDDWPMSMVCNKWIAEHKMFPGCGPPCLAMAQMIDAAMGTDPYVCQRAVMEAGAAFGGGGAGGGGFAGGPGFIPPFPKPSSSGSGSGSSSGAEAQMVPYNKFFGPSRWISVHKNLLWEDGKFPGGPRDSNERSGGPSKDIYFKEQRADILQAQRLRGPSTSSATSSVINEAAGTTR